MKKNVGNCNDKFLASCQLKLWWCGFYGQGNVGNKLLRMFESKNKNIVYVWVGVWKWKKTTEFLL